MGPSPLYDLRTSAWSIVKIDAALAKMCKHFVPTNGHPQKTLDPTLPIMQPVASS